MVTSVDGLLDKLLGQYQVLAYFIVLSNLVHVHINHYLLQHYLWTPSHHCKVPDAWKESLSLPLLSSNSLENSSRIFFDPDLTPSDPVYQPLEERSEFAGQINPVTKVNVHKMKRSALDQHESLYLQNQTLLVSKGFKNYSEASEGDERVPIKYPFDNTLASGKVPTYLNSEEPPENLKQREFASCEMYVDPTSLAKGTRPCIYGYVFNLQRNEWTITAEWGLVCERSWIRHWLRVSCSIGLVIGGIVFGLLSDRYGRRNVLLICVGAVGCLGLALHFVRRLLVFFILRCAQSVFSQGVHLISWTLIAELLPPKWRCRGLVVAGAAAPLGSVLAAVASFHLGHWRAIQLASSLPVLASLCYSCLVPESLRWLLTRGKVVHAHQEASRSARLNLLLLPPTAYSHMKNLSTNLTGEDQHTHVNLNSFHLTSLMKTPRVRRNILIICIMWFSISVTEKVLKGDVAPFGSSSLTSSKKDKSTLLLRMNNPLVEAMIISGVDAGGVILALMLSSLLYRRSLLMLLLLTSAALTLVFVGTMRMISDLWNSIPMVWIVLKMFGVFVIAGSRTLVGVILPEVTPTTSRATAIGLCLAVNGVGHIITPLIVLWGNLTFDIIPWIVSTALCLLSSLLMFLVPETAGVNLPDVAEEAEVVGLCHRRGNVIKSRKDPGYGRAGQVIDIDALTVGGFRQRLDGGRMMIDFGDCPTSSSVQDRYSHNPTGERNLGYRLAEDARDRSINRSPSNAGELRPFSPSGGSTSSCSVYSSTSFVGMKPENCATCFKNSISKATSSGLRQSSSTLSGDITSTEFLSDESNTENIDGKMTNDFNNVEYQLFNRYHQRFERIEEFQEEELESEDHKSELDKKDVPLHVSTDQEAPKIVSIIPITKNNPIRECIQEGSENPQLSVCALQMKHTRTTHSPTSVRKTNTKLEKKEVSSEQSVSNRLKSIIPDSDSEFLNESKPTDYSESVSKFSSVNKSTNHLTVTTKTINVPIRSYQSTDFLSRTKPTLKTQMPTLKKQMPKETDKKLSSISQNSKLIKLSERKINTYGSNNPIRTAKMIPNTKVNPIAVRKQPILGRQYSSVEISTKPKVRNEPKKTRSFILPRKGSSVNGRDVALRIAQFESSSNNVANVRASIDRMQLNSKSKIPIRKLRSNSVRSPVISEKVKQFESTNDRLLIDEKNLGDGKHTFRMSKSSDRNRQLKSRSIIPKGDVELSDNDQVHL